MAGMVVVGGGQAGYSIVSTLRRSGFSGEISLVCEEEALPYQRPPLSKRFLLGEVEEDRLLFRKEQFYSDNKISVFRGVKAVSIDRKKYAVFLSNNMELRYEKLFLATGGSKSFTIGSIKRSNKLRAPFSSPKISFSLPKLLTVT